MHVRMYTCTPTYTTILSRRHRANVRAESTKLDLLLTQLLSHVGYAQVETANMREL